MLERKLSRLTLQVQRANREELGRTCPHRPGPGGGCPSRPGAGKIPGRPGLHSQPLPRMKASRALGPNLNAARFPPSTSPPHRAVRHVPAQATRHPRPAVWLYEPRFPEGIL